MFYLLEDSLKLPLFDIHFSSHPLLKELLLFVFQDKLDILDVVQKNQLNWDEDLRKNLNTQSETSQTLQRLLTQQMSYNEVQQNTIKTLEMTISNLQITLESLQETRTDEANVTSTCKAIVHSFSLTDPLFW
jgi:MarR-like DNA-binding transcriptional regulator SgrR of sgrS sRNA